MIVSLILNPLFAIARLASLFEDKILKFAIKSKMFTPFSISSDFIWISGKSEPIPPSSNVFLAVVSAFLEAFSPWSTFVASLANKTFKLLIFFSLS